jgi:hypothetical protein
MAYETGAPPQPEHTPVHVERAPDTVPVARPARGYEATSVVVPAPTPGVTTYRLKGVETTEIDSE